MRWKVPKIWEGGEVWIIGGGPSIPKQFDVPESVIQKVMQGASPSLYSPYMEPIHNKHVIGVNAAFLIGDWIDMCFFGDNSFFKCYYKQLARFPGLKITSQAKYIGEEVKWIKVLPRNKKKPVGISDNPKTISWNSNSGAAAISIATNAGAKRIILLGFDMNLIDGRQWWHTVYGKPARKNLPFPRHMKGFPQIAKDAKKRGIEIINANPNSAVTEFKKVNVKDIL